MEFGPRALGARSILGDARSPTMQSVLNLKVKYRESFRPFAPSVLREDVADWFELDTTAPTCCWWRTWPKHLRREMTADEQALFGIDKLNVPRSAIPAVTHVDYSARIQTVHRETNPRYHALLSRFKAAHRLPGPRQHELQRPRRADRRARRRTPSAASWARRSTCSPWATASCARRSRTRRCGATTARPSRRIDAAARYFMPQVNTRVGATSTMTESDSSSAASSGYCGYFA